MGDKGDEILQHDQFGAGTDASTSPDDSVGASFAESFQGRWWVLHTRPRSEKKVAAFLDVQQVSYFLPLAHLIRQTRGRSREVHLPLFPGYLFLCGDENDRLAALQTNRLAAILEVGDQEGLKTDLQQIHRVLACGYQLELFPSIRTGALCRVKSGPLKGLEGVVLRRPKKWRVVLAVDFIGQSAELEVDPSILEIID